jgi:hypothetical protein
MAAIQSDFDTRRETDALLRTVASPDGGRVLALYATEAEAPGEFRIDLYNSDGTFIRNITPASLSGAFAPMVAWAPDNNTFAFIGRKSLAAETEHAKNSSLKSKVAPTVTPSAAGAPESSSSTSVPVFKTEQIYLCNREGFDLRPLTTREGLIYFSFMWAPDSHALAALACKENEWDTREKESRPPAGRPRLIDLNGAERLLSDSLTDAQPVWSPDSTKVATAFDKDAAVYDAINGNPRGAVIPLHDLLFAASITYDAKNLQTETATQANANQAAPVKADNNKTEPHATAQAQTEAQPVSFNPIVRLAWPQPDTLYVKTAYVRTYGNDPINTFQRWHIVHLSPQAALLSE